MYPQFDRKDSTIIPALSSEAIIAATRTYAHEGSTFVLLASQIMTEAGAQTFATSSGGGCPIYTVGGGIARIFGPGTSLLTEPLDPQQEGLVFADIDLSAIDAAKNFLDPAGHYARPDVTQLLFDNRPRRAMIHVERSQSNNLTLNGYEQLLPRSLPRAVRQNANQSSATDFCICVAETLRYDDNSKSGK